MLSLANTQFCEIFQYFTANTIRVFRRPDESENTFKKVKTLIITFMRIYNHGQNI